MLDANDTISRESASCAAYCVPLKEHITYTVWLKRISYVKSQKNVSKDDIYKAIGLHPSKLLMRHHS